MELQHSKSKLGKRNVHGEHSIGIPAEYAFTFNNTSKGFLPDPATEYQILPSPSNHYSKIRPGRGDSVIAKMIKLCQSMDILAQGIREHVKLGPKLTETVKGKLSLGARILQVGGVEKVFKQRFDIRDDEKLLKASQCYLSTTTGPIAGLLFVSTNRVAFCSDRSIRVSSPTGKQIKVNYKVVIPLRKIKRVHERENAKKPAQKYVHMVTGDNFDFWFMGFLNHQRTLKYLQQAIHQGR